MIDDKDVEKLLDKLENVDGCYKTDNEEIVLKDLITRILNDEHADDCFTRVPLLERAVLALLKKAVKEKKDKNEIESKDVLI